MMKVIIAGHLGADVETRYTEKGKKVSTIRVATNSRRSGKDETVWWRVTMWDDDFDGILPYLKKGSGVIVMGDFSRCEIYMDRDGKPQTSLEITARTVEFSPFGRGMSQDGQVAGQGTGQFAGQAAQTARPPSPYAATQQANPPSYAASQHHPASSPPYGHEEPVRPPSYAATQQANPPSYGASQHHPAPPPPYGHEEPVRPPSYTASYVIPPSPSPTTSVPVDQPKGEYPPSKEDVPF